MELRSILAARPFSTDSLDEWWQATADVRTGTPVDRALLGGAYADRLGFAFAAGYQAALQALVPSVDGADHGIDHGIGALCVTESGGNAPKHIATTLVADGDGFVITGAKKWATAAPLARHLLVVASTGRDGDRNRLRMVRVATDAAGVTLAPSSAPFVPEIPHAAVTLDRVRVAASDVFPGDGYADYVKPFRTVEDVHVHAAVAGYLANVCVRLGARELVERWLAAALVVRGLAQLDARSADTHLALAGAIATVTVLVGDTETAWRSVHASGDAELARWTRDRPLLAVAGAARTARRDTAWTAIG